MKSLNERMSFGHVIRVHDDGTITDDWQLFTPEVIYGSDDELASQIGDWALLSGFTGQDSYNGPVMHASEYVGGALEGHIRSTPGLYVAVVVDDWPPDEPDAIGWVIATKGASKS